MVAQSPAVHLEQISKRFVPEKTVLSNISLEANPQEWIAIIGPSGCGKTTLLRLIAGLLSPEQGSIKFSGNQTPEIAFIFQDPTLLPWRTVEQNLKMPMELRGIDKAIQKQRVESLLNLVDLEESRDVYPKHLSGGMRMRVSLARALSLEPELILFDEPFAALDVITRNRLNEELIDIKKVSPATAFFVTHSVNEAVFLADKILILTKDGQPHSIETVSFPLERKAALREHSDYQECVAHIHHKLHEVL